ncbi:hypothetical protein [Vibrio sp. WXL210]|uniref:hypothetical protein n=1 Tax=Vibrio sp. WXL210 TaxID=3450709 RepID=UPI003EC6687D
MKKVLLATLIASASSTAFAANWSHNQSIATVKSEVPPVCGVRTNYSDVKLDVTTPRGEAVVEFAVMNNISDSTNVSFAGSDTDLTLIGGSSAQAARNIKVKAFADGEKFFDKNLREFPKKEGDVTLTPALTENNKTVEWTNKIRVEMSAIEGVLWKAGSDQATYVIANITCL